MVFLEIELQTEAPDTWHIDLAYSLYAPQDTEYIIPQLYSKTGNHLQIILKYLSL